VALATVLLVLGPALVLLRGPWARGLARSTGFLTNRALDPDAVARWLGAAGVLLSLAGAALAALSR
jgi:hypothetical protein